MEALIEIGNSVSQIFGKNQTISSTETDQAVSSPGGDFNFPLHQFSPSPPVLPLDSVRPV